MVSSSGASVPDSAKFESGTPSKTNLNWAVRVFEPAEGDMLQAAIIFHADVLIGASKVIDNPVSSKAVLVQKIGEVIDIL